MRPWMIVLTSAAVAIAAAAAMAGAVLSLTRHAATMPVLAPLLPELAVVALGVYALCAVVLTAANLVGLSLLLRRHFARTPAHRGPAGPDWTAALAAGGLRRLAPLSRGRRDRTAPSCCAARFARKRRDGRSRASATSGPRAPISLAH